MNNSIIKVDNLSKRYRIGIKDEKHNTIIGGMLSWIKSPISNYKQVQKLSKFDTDVSDDIIWAIKDISFEVNKGEILGIIGKNGAGKSTLLKILSRIVDPTNGQAVVQGRVASLLEIGTGFHGELSGRENIFLNGSILGMTKDEIQRNFNEIVEFSEIEKFIDTPVKRYSSGMYVRLAFAVAAHLDPDVLIVDEVLAVGDAEFQKKCLGKMGETAKSGRTVLFVSHNMSTIQDLCNRTILLENGGIIKDGDTSEVIRYYLQPKFEKIGSRDLRKKDVSRKSTGKLRASNIKILDKNNKTATIYDINDPITIEVEVDNVNANGFVVSILITNQQGALIYHIRSQDSDLNTKNKKSPVTVQITIPRLNIIQGRYLIDVWIGNHLDIMEDHVENAISFEVVNSGHSKLPLRSIIHETGNWKVLQNN